MLVSWSPLRILVLALIACGSGEPVGDAKARDLQTALHPTATPVDTARQRADSQFNTCLYVYDNAEKLRECLVLKFEWPAERAARRIATYTAELQRIADSLRRTRDSVLAEERAKLRREDAFAAKQPYWGSRYLRLYYTNTPNCATLTRMSRKDRITFSSVEAAERAGYTRTEEVGC
jgi:hypothetical protein